MSRKKWPTSMPKVYQPRIRGSFEPPPGWNPYEPPKYTVQPPTSPKTLPCDFRVELYAEPFPPVKTLQRALQRHRLLFLWYASPKHLHVPENFTPGKESLYDALGLAEHGPGPTHSAEVIFKYADKIDGWLSEQQVALGTGPTGKPLRDITDDWPTSHFAYWAFDDDRQTPLHDSYADVARCLGVALRKPRSDWIGDMDVPLIRQCEIVARPLVADDTGTTWNDTPLVQWHYPDTLRDHIAALDPLVMIEAGGNANLVPTVQPVHPIQLKCAVMLHGPGQAPMVAGETMPILSDPRYVVIAALVKAGPDGLSKDELEGQTRSSGARKTLRRLHDSDPRWAKVIQLAGSPGMRYRLLHNP